MHITYTHTYIYIYIKHSIYIVVIGSANALNQNTHWETFIRHCKDKASYKLVSTTNYNRYNQGQNNDSAKARGYISFPDAEYSETVFLKSVPTKASPNNDKDGMNDRNNSYRCGKYIKIKPKRKCIKIKPEN